MTQDEAYEFCYNLDQRARLLEIHNEEEMLFLKAMTGRFVPNRICLDYNFINDNRKI